MTMGSMRLSAQPIYLQGRDGDSISIPHPADSANLWVMIEDSTYVYLRQGGSSFVIPADDVSAAYSFDMIYDSTFLISYDFAECRRNGERLTLRHWKDRRVVNANARLLSFNSTTDTFTCRVGDTLSFFRELYWKDLVTGEQDTANYYALDSLDYAVELVRLSDSTRVATVDTIGILANTTMGPPRIHGTHPLMAVVRYVVPTSLDGVKTFLRLLVLHRGSGTYWFTRTDHVTMGLSRQLNDSNWQHFLNVFNPAAPKTAIEQLETAHPTSSHSESTIQAVSNGGGRYSITFDCDPNGGRTLVGIFDAAGRQVYTPYVTVGAGGRARAEYLFGSPGAYFIALFHGDRLVGVRKVFSR